MTPLPTFFSSFLAFFALGTLGFWVLIVSLSIVIISCTENEYYKFPSFITVALVACYWSIIHAAFNWRIIGIAFASYGLLGVAWAYFRWCRRGTKLSDSFEQKYGKVLSASNHSSLQDQLSVYENKALITGWIAYWPWSFFWNVLGDFFTMLFDSVRHLFENVSKRKLAKFSIAPPPQEERAGTMASESSRRRY